MAKDSNNNEDEIVYIAIKDEYDDEGDKMTLISHVRKNDTWIMGEPTIMGSTLVG